MDTDINSHADETVMESYANTSLMPGCASSRVDITESTRRERVLAILLAISAQGESRIHWATGRVGERAAEGSGLGLRPAGSDAGAVNTTSQQAMVICTPFEGNITVR